MATRSDVIATPVPAAEPAPKRPPGKKMVCWYDPLVLAKTGVQALVSATFGQQADRRILDALAVPGLEAEDLSRDEAGRPREELWLDYVADLGDGWDSTYAVALAVSRKTLTLRDEHGAEYETQGGQVLVFGGDEVYPTAKVEEYQARTVQPWASAIRGQRPPPHLFAVPGNHDWYDGLVSFMRLFCSGRTPPNWTTHQRRSYFAAKLPHGWWLIGTDMQLESDLDAAQVSYFREIRQKMGPEDRIILCLAEPAWLLDQIRPEKKGAAPSYLEKNLDILQRDIFGREVSVFLAGDIHHYRRHEGPDGRQKIIAGGGGAFLHPTHEPRTQQHLAGGYSQRMCYPSAPESRRATWGNLAFLGHNPTFGLVTGLLYLLFSWVFSVGLSPSGGPPSLGSALGSVLLDPGSIVVSALLLLGMVGFADQRFGKGRWLAGVLHGLVHVFAAFFLAWGAAWLTGSVFGLEALHPSRDLVLALLVFAGGFLVGPTVLGLYLLISLNGFGAHPNEAFSSMAIQDWKNFVRMRIDRDGRLWLFPVGIRRVPRAWKPGATVREPEWVADPADKAATPPMLIEPPIIVGGSRPPPQGARKGNAVFAGLAPP
jgi:hypothetical protein